MLLFPYNIKIIFTNHVLEFLNTLATFKLFLPMSKAKFLISNKNHIYFMLIISLLSQKHFSIR